MAMVFRIRTCRYYSRRYYKLIFFLFAVLLFLLWNRVPEPPKTENNTLMNRPPPRQKLASKPQFLHRSQFREHPDYEYETFLDYWLKRIEEKTLAENQGNVEATQTIWQISLGPDRKPMDRGSDSIAFENENKEWDYMIITSAFATSFINDIFGEVPYLVRAYNAYPYDVLRADLLRYLVLWYFGGYYADTDVYPARSIKSCPALSPFFQSAPPPDVSLVLGIEIDEPYASPQLRHDWHWSRVYGFVQYNMYAPKRFSPFLRRAIVRVLAHNRQRTQRFTRFSTYDENSILETTGPGVFTDAILDVLSDTLPRSHPLITTSVEKDQDVGEISSHAWGRVTWAPFHRLKEPLWVDAADAVSNDMGGLGVLPIQVWGNGQRHSEAGYFHDEQACVNHRFGRTWKKGWWEYLFG